MLFNHVAELTKQLGWDFPTDFDKQQTEKADAAATLSLVLAEPLLHLRLSRILSSSCLQNPCSIWIGVHPGVSLLLRFSCWQNPCSA